MRRFEVKEKCSFDEFAERSGTLIDDNEIDHIIDYDCDAYDPDGNPLFFFRKNVLDPKLCKTAYLSLRKAAAITNNRGRCSGVFQSRSRPKFQLQWPHWPHRCA